jgi:hypothetical protein
VPKAREKSNAETKYIQAAIGSRRVAHSKQNRPRQKGGRPTANFARAHVCFVRLCQCLRILSSRVRDETMPLSPKIKKGHHRGRCSPTSLACLPPEILADIVSRLKARDHAAAVLASRHFAVLSAEERGRLHFARIAPLTLARAGSLAGLCYWHEVDPWRIDIHCLRAAAEAGHLPLVKWIIDDSTGGGCPTEALCAAARGGHIDVVRWLLDERNATIVNQTLTDAIFSNSVETARFILDRARQIDRQTDTKCDNDGDDDCNDGQEAAVNADGHDNDGGGDDDEGDRTDGSEHDRCWGYRPMRMAVRTDNVAMVELIYERCCGWDPTDLAGRPLCAAVEENAITVVEWILDRCIDNNDGICAALKAALCHAHHDCAVAILSRWPDVARPITLYSWDVAAWHDVDAGILQDAHDVASGSLPDPWPPVSADPEQIYRALIVRSLSDRFNSIEAKNLYAALLSQTHCEAPFRWALDVSGVVPTIYCVAHAAEKGAIGRLALYRERGLLTPDHVVEAMKGAAEGGRVDVLDYIWSMIGDNDDDLAKVRAHAQRITDAAAKSGDWSVVEWLAAHIGAQAHCTAGAFKIAASQGHAAFLEHLYATGADRCRHAPDEPCENNKDWRPFVFGLATPCGLYDVNDLWRDVARGGYIDVAKVLHAHGALEDVHLRGDASLRGHAALCAFDIAIHKPTKDRLMVHYAVQNRDLACLRLALASGFAWKEWWPNERGPIGVAAKKGSDAIKALLLAHPDQIGPRQHSDWCPTSDSDYDSGED